MIPFYRTICPINRTLQLHYNTVYINFDNKIFKFDIPDNYLHLLNCKAEISEIPQRCNSTKTIIANCSRLTANLSGGVIDNYYNKPSYKKPYYYLTRRAENLEVFYSRDNEVFYVKTREENIKDNTVKSLLSETDVIPEKNDTKLEIHVGNSKCKVNKIELTYIRIPIHVSMTQEDLLEAEDNTQVLEFPDYVCYEIINIYVKLLLENASDPRLSTVTPINQSIAVG